MSHSISEQLRFSPAAGFTIRADLNDGGLSSDLGPLLLREVDRQIGLTARITGALNDKRPTAGASLLDNDSPSKVPGGRRPNLAPEFIADFSSRLKLEFVPDGCGDLALTFGPEDIFHYAYAVFYSPGYRGRYAQFLKMDFPRLPLTSDLKLFLSLCALGKELTVLHLMEQHPTLQTRYPVAGDNSVTNIRYTEAANGMQGRVWINTTQYFDNVPPEVWGYHIGGYQVCQKWLKDRKKRRWLARLSYRSRLTSPSISGQSNERYARFSIYPANRWR